eukprot:m.216468 g.216468  ORF g.216468 m.216468 type:complete len:562 (-) comp15879_c0_seq1:113-1798(-)
MNNWMLLRHHTLVLFLDKENRMRLLSTRPNFVYLNRMDMLFFAHLLVSSFYALEGSDIPGAAVTANMVLVKEWVRDHCPQFPVMPPKRCIPGILPDCDNDNIDAMPRVWFDELKGIYRMLGSVSTNHGPSRGQTGDSLDTMKHTCTPYINTTPLDANLSHFNADVWIEAPFVLNSTHVYALAHVDSYNATINSHYTGINLYSAITLFESLDGGASFHLARPPPHNLVATSPYDNRDGRFGRGPGYGMPSSIFRDPQNKMFYTILLTNWGRDVGAQKGGLCLLRASDITDPTSWRAWGGQTKNFSVKVNVSPLLEPVPDPLDYTCELLLDSNGNILNMRHISLLWSTFYNQYLAFGEANVGRGSLSWVFSLSKDLIHWSVPVPVDAPNTSWWNLTGNASITPMEPKPGRWIVAPLEAPYWVQPSDTNQTYKFKALCSPCTSGRPCEVCPSSGDLCKTAENVSRKEFDSIPSATIDFSCGLVYNMTGYSDYIYPTLVDDTYHKTTNADPSLNIVGQNAHVVFVANVCANSDPWQVGDDHLKCTILDTKGRPRRNIVKSKVQFR